MTAFHAAIFNSASIPCAAASTKPLNQKNWQIYIVSGVFKENLMEKSFNPPVALLDFIKRHDKFIITGHEEPDADCIGSQLALASLLRRLDKTVLLRSAGPFRKTEIISYKNLFSSEISAEDRADAAVIIIDCSNPSRTGCLCDGLKGLPLGIIDHHAAGNAVNADCAYIEPASPSSTVLVFSLFKSLSVKINEDEARLLFLGLCTDTGFFRHIDSGGGEIFRIAAELADAGASPKETFYKISGGKTLNSRLLLGTVLCHTEAHINGKLLISTETMAETEKYGVENRDSDALYQLLSQIENVEAVVVVRQSAANKCAIGMRSRDSVNVSKIAAVFGGGGHKNAAGAHTEGNVNSLKQAVISEFNKIMP
ncbi:MAG: bifunctional oligoribonuclease/PAP phosphatase NrnA [Spirochaetaceae bacterium]|jgi:phosphoesterase RecJ-like protein|nr:bifunctional oligoribonuclease/PAP phosphatase NrnA [Spirochaetaceae bacterium]